VGVYDTDTYKSLAIANTLQVKKYASEAEVFADDGINAVIILTPSNLHYTQIIKAINASKHVIVEKPATFYAHELAEIIQLSSIKKVDIFTILQVRLNPAIIALTNFIRHGKLGKLRGVSLIQRWQRPLEYFTGWRGAMVSGGGVLREFSIHYLDALISLVGMPIKIASASFYKTKLRTGDVDDTIYANLDFGDFGGNIEISVAAEPSNLECSLSLMSEFGYVKLGGKSLDVVSEAKFLDPTLAQQLDTYYEDAVKQGQVGLASQGASPYHPELYRQIIVNPDAFRLNVTHDVIKLIEDIYAKKPLPDKVK
jgi:predicted dehydrogenase